MSLFIGFVPAHVSVEQLTAAFEETFSATVMVKLSKDKVNKNDVKYKSATIDIISNSRDLSHFISQIDDYGSNTFISDRQHYRVQHGKQREPVSRVKTFTPYIM
jgi:hypothetical protein